MAVVAMTASVTSAITRNAGINIKDALARIFWRRKQLLKPFGKIEALHGEVFFAQRPSAAAAATADGGAGVMGLTWGDETV